MDTLMIAIVVRIIVSISVTGIHITIPALGRIVAIAIGVIIAGVAVVIGVVRIEPSLICAFPRRGATV
jgi:hypothetical protein